MKKFLIVFGTRPEAIKLAPVIKEMESQPELEVRTCITSQHDKLLEDALNAFRIEVDYDLQIMEESQTLEDITQKILVRLIVPFVDFKPDMVIVQGDTTSAFAAALAAYYNKIPIAHVEAGLRTYNKYHPYPEEMNRVMIDAMSDLLFAPTEEAYRNLEQHRKVYMTGNTVVDALHMMSDQIGKISVKSLPRVDILVTIHRRENWDRLKYICKAIKDIAVRYPDHRIVWPLHPNPLVTEIVKTELGNISNISLIEAVSYFYFIKFLMACDFIITDSGGIQEEAPSFNKPVLVIRNWTERMEVVKAGGAIVLGTDPAEIFVTAALLINNREVYNRMAKAKNPYGDGTAAKKIVEILNKWNPS